MILRTRVLRFSGRPAGNFDGTSPRVPSSRSRRLRRAARRWLRARVHDDDGGATDNTWTRCGNAESALTPVDGWKGRQGPVLAEKQKRNGRRTAQIPDQHERARDQGADGPTERVFDEIKVQPVDEPRVTAVQESRRGRGRLALHDKMSVVVVAEIVVTVAAGAAGAAAAIVIVAVVVRTRRRIVVGTRRARVTVERVTNALRPARVTTTAVAAMAARQRSQNPRGDGVDDGRCGGVGREQQRPTTATAAATVVPRRRGRIGRVVACVYEITRAPSSRFYAVVTIVIYYCYCYYRNRKRLDKFGTEIKRRRSDGEKASGRTTSDGVRFGERAPAV